MTTYTATITDRERLVVTGTSDGKGDPVYEFEPNYGDGGPIRALLEEKYDDGLYGTGSVGQVRDMVWAMTAAAQELGLEVNVPPRTSSKATKEANADQKKLPDGAVY